eukprot:34020-Pyramimonas_sp.AAC.1
MGSAAQDPAQDPVQEDDSRDNMDSHVQEAALTERQGQLTSGTEDDGKDNMGPPVQEAAHSRDNMGSQDSIDWRQLSLDDPRHPANGLADAVSLIMETCAQSDADMKKATGVNCEGGQVHHQGGGRNVGRTLGPKGCLSPRPRGQRERGPV